MAQLAMAINATAMNATMKIIKIKQNIVFMKDNNGREKVHLKEIKYE